LYGQLLAIWLGCFANDDKRIRLCNQFKNQKS